MVSDVRPLRLLMSAYACEPSKGSEPGVGWRMAQEMAQHHEVWVLTRANNQASIEAELARKPIANLHFVYFDLPRWMAWWKRGGRGVQIYYYLWQVGAALRARRLHKEVHLDLVHHTTFGKYWAPSFVSMLPVPFVWGPLGGGESAPKAFRRGLGPSGWMHEALRDAARYLAERDPFVRLTARRSSVALAKTEDTGRRLAAIGAQRVQVLSEVGVRDEDVAELTACGNRRSSPIVLFASIGNLLALKGFHLGLQAFAKADLAEAEYWIIGDGPERSRLEDLASTLHISHQVVFLGRLPRVDAMKRLAECDVLIHPSLHDSGGWVCIEAMAARKPVVCLDLGGPALQVADDAGVRIAAECPEEAVAAIADAMSLLAHDAELRSTMGAAGLRHVSAAFAWEWKSEVLNRVYQDAIGPRPPNRHNGAN